MGRGAENGEVVRIIVLPCALRQLALTYKPELGILHGEQGHRGNPVTGTDYISFFIYKDSGSQPSPAKRQVCMG